MHLALAASVLLCRCMRSASTNMRLLVWICGSYLWPASLPKEPAVRGGLEGFTQVGSGVFCTSVLTSGSISEGEGVSLAPAIAVCLARALPPEDSGNMCPPPAVRTGRLTQKPTPPEKTASPVSVSLRWGGGGAPASLPHHGLLGRTEANIHSSPAHHGLLHPRWRRLVPVRLPHSRVVTVQRQQLGQPNGFT